MKTREQMLAERARDRLLAEAGAVVGCLDGVDPTDAEGDLAQAVAALADGVAEVESGWPAGDPDHEREMDALLLEAPGVAGIESQEAFDARVERAIDEGARRVAEAGGRRALGRGLEALLGAVEHHPEAVALVRHPGVDALREILSRWFSPKQGGGISGLGRDGRWHFVSAGLGQATAEQIDALFALAGLEPKPVEPRGACADCRWAKDGRERGYAFPCGPCTRPWHSSFEPVSGEPPDGLGLVDRVVRRAAGDATELDDQIDDDGRGSVRSLPWLIEAAQAGGRDAVVRAIDEHVAKADRRAR